MHTWLLEKPLRLKLVCCCCWVTSVISNSGKPHRWEPTRLPHPWDSPSKNTRVGCHFLLHVQESEKWKWSCSVVSNSATPWTAACQAPLSMGFSRQEYWSEVPKNEILVKNSPANAGDLRDRSLIPGSGRSPGEGNGPLQYSYLENPMDWGAW